MTPVWYLLSTVRELTLICSACHGRFRPILAPRMPPMNGCSTFGSRAARGPFVDLAIRVTCPQAKADNFLRAMLITRQSTHLAAPNQINDRQQDQGAKKCDPQGRYAEITLTQGSDADERG